MRGPWSIVASLVVSLPATAGINVWTRVPIAGGVVSSLAAPPSRPGTVVAAGGARGVYRSADAGRTWHPSVGGLAGASVGVAVAPADADIVYAWLSRVVGSSLAASTDGGLNWRLMPGPGPVTGLAVDGGDARTLLAVTVDRNIVRSVDGGETWKTLGFLVPRETLSVAADAFRPGAFAAIVTRPFGPFAYVSADAGDTWTCMVAVTPANAVTWDRGTPGAVLVGTSYGQIERVGADGRPMGTLVDDIARLGAVRSIATDASGRLIIAVGNGVGTSRDGGRTWAWPGGLPPVLAAAVVEGPDGPEMLVGTDGFGTWRSGDEGGTWAESNAGLDASIPGALALPTGGLPWLAATIDAPALARSADGGASWRLAVTPGQTRNLDLRVIESMHPRILARSDAGVLASDDGGGSWWPLPGAFWPLAVDPANPRVWIGQAGGIVRTEDGGVTWETFPGHAPSFITEVVIDPANNDRVYAGVEPGTGSDDRGVWVSDDGGRSWRESNAGLSEAMAPGEGVASLALDRRASRCLLAATDRGVWASADGAATWTATALSGLVVRRVLADPDHEGWAFAITSEYQGRAPEIARVWRTSDWGRSWREAGPGLPGGNVGRIVVGPGEPRTLLVSTPTGAYSLTIDDEPVRRVRRRLAPVIPGQRAGGVARE